MDWRNDTAPLHHALTVNASGIPSPPDDDIPALNYSGLVYVFIPTITILGNLLVCCSCTNHHTIPIQVIISVVRFKALQSAINYLILGLAIADLLVALFVMPYAVYVHVSVVHPHLPLRIKHVTPDKLSVAGCRPFA